MKKNKDNTYICEANKKNSFTYLLEQAYIKHGFLPDIFYAPEIDYSEIVSNSFVFNEKNINIAEAIGVNIVKTINKKYYRELIPRILLDLKEDSHIRDLLKVLIQKNDFESIGDIILYLREKLKTNKKEIRNKAYVFLELCLDIAGVYCLTEQNANSDILKNYPKLFIEAISLANFVFEIYHSSDKNWTNNWFIKEEAIKTIFNIPSHEFTWGEIIIENKHLFNLFKIAYEQTKKQKQDKINFLLTTRALTSAISAQNDLVVEFYIQNKIFKQDVWINCLNNVLEGKIIEAYQKRKNYNLDYIKNLLDKFNKTGQENAGLLLMLSVLKEEKLTLKYLIDNLDTWMIVGENVVSLGEVLKSGVYFDILISKYTTNDNPQKSVDNEYCPLYSMYKKIIDACPISKEFFLKLDKFKHTFFINKLQQLKSADIGFFPYSKFKYINHEKDIDLIVLKTELECFSDSGSKDKKELKIKL